MVKQLLQRARRAYKEGGPKGFVNSVEMWARTEALEAIQPVNDGVDIMSEDWDTLVILDACRFDVFSEVCDLDGDLTRRSSRGATTARFVEENFAGKKFYDTVYISANAAVGDKIDKINMYKFQGIWGDRGTATGWGVDREIVSPEETVSAALEARAEYPNKRLIIHFLQPHCPYIIKNGEKISSDSKYRTLRAAAENKVRSEEIRTVYRENMAYVLNYVADLAEELNGKTVITADHGELLGESVPTIYKLLHHRYGASNYNLYRYGHWNHIRVPELTEIPWLELPVTGERPKIKSADATVGADYDADEINKQLRVLGYK
jgi:hypothetical protein